MSEPIAETVEAPEAPAVETSAPESPPAPTWAPDQREWGAVVHGMKTLVEKGYFDEEEEEEEDLADLDLGQLTQRYVDGRLREVEPYVQAAAREAGEKRMNELLDDFTQRPEVGNLSKEARNQVGYVAESMLSRLDPEGKDPQAAVYAVYEAAKMLGNLTKTERESAVKEYKDSFKKTPYNDPNYSGPGERSREPAKTYDEVIARYTGDEEV